MCGLFPDAKPIVPPCSTQAPAAETDTRPQSDVVEFADPAGTRGTGSPSGGPNPAIGAAIYEPGNNSADWLTTCTLPQNQSALCDGIVSAFVDAHRSPLAHPSLSTPGALALAPDGTLYVADTRLLAIAPSGNLRFVGDIDGANALAYHNGALYVSDMANNLVERVGALGNVEVVAGNGTGGFSGDGGPARRAQLFEPTAITFGPDGALYIADQGNERIRRVATDGTITTIAGRGDPSDTGDGGPATHAGVDPHALAFDRAGNLYVFQQDTKTIRVIDPHGVINSAAQSRYVSAFAVAPDGSIAIADYGNFGLARITSGGTITALPFHHSGVLRPVGIAVAPNGDTYVDDSGVVGGGAVRLLRVAPNGQSTTITPR
jgi:sugar lactone lactonase YvrE